MSTPAVYEAIGKVSKIMAVQGVRKGRRNEQQGYNFRGIDEVMNALAPVLADSGLVVLPRMLSRTVTERTTQKGGVLFYVVVEAEFDFVAILDASTHVVRMFGEAMDSADKATNKAMSAAYKYACFQAFCIPVAGTPDADQTTHEVAAKVPEGYEDWLLDFTAAADNGSEAVAAAWKGAKLEYRKHFDATTSDEQRTALRARTTAANKAHQAEAVPA